MPSTRFSRRRVGHQAFPEAPAVSSDFSNDCLINRASVSSSPTWNFLAKARDQMPTRCKSEEPAGASGNAWWPTRLLENRVEGISENTQTDRKVDTVLASLIGA